MKNVETKTVETGTANFVECGNDIPIHAGNRIGSGKD